MKGKSVLLKALLMPKPVELPTEWNYRAWRSATRDVYISGMSRIVCGFLILFLCREAYLFIVMSALLFLYIGYVLISVFKTHIGYIRFARKYYKGQMWRWQSRK